MDDFKCDIFVSYAGVDNRPSLGDNEGQVTKLVNQLRIVLDNKLGGNGYSLCMDDHSRGEDVLAFDIAKRLENSNVLLSILTDNALKSDRWKREFRLFHEKGQRCSTHIAIVDYGFSQQERVKVTEEFDKVKIKNISYHLLNDPGENSSCYEKINDLGHNLKIFCFGSETGSILKSAQTVFLAEEEGDDLYTKRMQVRRYLEQQGIQVLPQTSCIPRTDQTDVDVKKLIETDLKRSGLFIQLLNSKSGKLSKVQYDYAQSLKLPILRWRDPNLIIDDINHPLLKNSTIIACPLEEFKQQVLGKLKQQKLEQELADSPQHNKKFSINVCCPDDEACANDLSNLVSQYGAYFVSRRFTRDSEERSSQQVRERLDNHLRTCDIILTIYGKCSLESLSNWIKYMKKIVALRPNKPRMILCEAPPKPKDPQLKFLDVELHDCCDEFNSIEKTLFS